MDPSGQSFIDYALPELAPTDTMMSTKAFGEESGAGLAGVGDSMTETGGLNWDKRVDEACVMTTWAVGEESGDGWIQSYPPEDVGDGSDVSTTITIDVITGLEPQVGWCWAPEQVPDPPKGELIPPSGEEFVLPVPPIGDGDHMVEVSPPVVSDTDTHDGAVIPRCPLEDLVVTTMAVGEESGSFPPELPIGDADDPNQAEPFIEPVNSLEPTNTKDSSSLPVDPEPSDTGDGSTPGSEVAQADPAGVPPGTGVAAVMPLPVEPVQWIPPDKIDPIVCWFGPPETANPDPPQSVETGQQEDRGESGDGSLPGVFDPPIDTGEESPITEALGPEDPATERRRFPPADGGSDPVDPGFVPPPDEPQNTATVDPPAEEGAANTPSENPEQQSGPEELGANLTLTEIVVPAIATAGDRFDVSWTYINSGTTSASPHSSYCSVTFSRNEIYGDEDDILASVLYGDSSYEDLLPQASKSFSQSIYFSEFQLGDGFLFFEQDGYNFLDETNESDNIMMQAITVVQPNLSISAIAAPVQAVAGQSISVSWTVTNQGEQPLTSPYRSDGIFFSANDVYGDGDDVLIHSSFGLPWPNPVPLQPQESITFNQELNLSYSAGGQGYLFFVVDSSNYLLETIESDNLMSQEISILQPNLAISDISAPDQAVSGNEIEVSWSAVNQSDIPLITPYFYDKVVFSKNNIFGDEDDIYMKGSYSSHYNSLQPLDRDSLSTKIALPQGYVGEGYLLFKLDSGNLIAESDETDNIFVQPINILPRNLSIVDLAVPSTVSAGSFTQLTINVRNDGDQFVNRFSPSKIVFSANQIFGDDDDQYVLEAAFHNFTRASWLNSSSVELAPGQESTFDVDIYIPPHLEGTGYLFVDCDSGAFASAALDVLHYENGYAHYRDIHYFDIPLLSIRRDSREDVAVQKSSDFATNRGVAAVSYNVTSAASMSFATLHEFLPLDIPTNSLEVSSVLPSAPSTSSVVVPEPLALSVSAASPAPSQSSDLPQSWSPFDNSPGETTDSQPELPLTNPSRQSPSGEPSETTELSPNAEAKPVSSTTTNPLLPLFEESGIAPQRQPSLPSDSPFARDPLSGLKVGELVRAV